jgi:hypothetical protein
MEKKPYQTRGLLGATRKKLEVAAKKKGLDLNLLELAKVLAK